MNKEEKKHFDELATFGCALCFRLGYGEGSPAEIHHIRRHGGVRVDAPAVPLCPEHHRGNSGVHGMGRKAFERHYGITELELRELIVNIIENRKAAVKSNI